MVMVVVEDELVADSNEVPAKGLPEVLFGENLCRRPDGDGLGVEQQHSVAASRIVKAVSGQDNGSARMPFVVDETEDHRLRCDIETIDWFVEQENVGILCEALGNKNSLTLTTREFVKLTIGKIFDNHSFHREFDSFVIDRTKAAEEAEAGIAGKRHRVAHRDGQALIDLGRLQNEGGWLGR